MRIHATREFFVKGAAAFYISAGSSDTLTVLSYFFAQSWIYLPELWLFLRNLHTVSQKNLHDLAVL